MLGSTTGLHPFVHLILLELPEAAHAMCGHFMFINPLVHGVIADPEVLAYFADRQPTIFHLGHCTVPLWAIGLLAELVTYGIWVKRTFDPDSEHKEVYEYNSGYQTISADLNRFASRIATKRSGMVNI